jgi:hypothetical protein
MPTIDTSRLSDRDRKAVDEALTGWWTDSMKSRERRIAWWREARFGCFIHWGVYSGPGGEWEGQPFRGYAEHLMRIKKIPRARYAKEVVGTFNPTKFDAAEWARIIKGAGMKYVVITAKHHDGFAMYDSKVSDYNIVKATPYGRDPLRALQQACKAEGLRFGFYYSHAFDWEHPDAPGNDWDYDNPGGDRKLHGGDQWYDQHPELLLKAQKYVDEKSIPQIVELLRSYQPDILWFDTPHKLPLSENVRILKAIREVSHEAVVNGRLVRGPGFNLGDYANTADRPAEVLNTEGDWEAIPTTNESYGYHKHDNSHKPPEHFVQLLAKSAARGGNELMNIGPMGDGRIDPKDVAILEGIGAWLKVNGKSIYATERTPLPVQPWGESSRSGNKIYLQVFDWPKDGKLVLGGLRSDAPRIWLQSDPIAACCNTTRLNKDDIAIDVPQAAPDKADTVLVVEFTGELNVNPARPLSAKSHVNVLRVFDGELHGKTIRFDQGKSTNAYAFNWTAMDEWIDWKVRLSEDATFDVSIRYSTGTPQNSGSFVVQLADQALEATIEPTDSPARPRDVALGKVQLKKGEFEIAIKPVEIKGGELFRPFTLTLVPSPSGRGSG